MTDFSIPPTGDTTAEIPQRKLRTHQDADVLWSRIGQYARLPDGGVDMEKVKEITRDWFATTEDDFLEYALYLSTHSERYINRWVVVCPRTPDLAESLFTSNRFKPAHDEYLRPESEALCIVRNGVIMVQRLDAQRGESEAAE